MIGDLLYKGRFIIQNDKLILTAYGNILFIMLFMFFTIVSLLVNLTALHILVLTIVTTIAVTITREINIFFKRSKIPIHLSNVIYTVASPVLTTLIIVLLIYKDVVWH